MSLLKYLLLFIVTVSVTVSLLTGCGKTKGEMKIEDYAKIESELEIPDPDLDPKKVGEVAGKYGFTFEQYKNFYVKVQKDPKLQEKLGELTLNKQKPKNK